MKYISIIFISIYILLLLPITITVPLSFMLFDKPGADTNPIVWGLLTAFLTTPVMIFFSIIFQIIFFKQRNYYRALLAILLPFLNCLAIYFLFTKFQ